MAVTLGMKDLLSAKRIRLYTDGGAWKQTILRILLFAEPAGRLSGDARDRPPGCARRRRRESAQPPPSGVVTISPSLRQARRRRSAVEAEVHDEDR